MSRARKKRSLFPGNWSPLDRLLVVIALLVNVWAFSDWTGLAAALAPDAAARALLEVRRAKKDEPALDLRRDALIQNLQGRHPWAGNYAGPSGQELSLAPGMDYRRKWIDWSGHPVFDRGELRDQPSRVVLRSAKRDVEPALFRIVRWSGRVYLIGDDELIDFANAVNKGTEPRKTEAGAGGAAPDGGLLEHEQTAGGKGRAGAPDSIVFDRLRAFGEAELRLTDAPHRALIEAEGSRQLAPRVLDDVALPHEMRSGLLVRLIHWPEAHALVFPDREGVMNQRGGSGDVLGGAGAHGEIIAGG